jgi:hypothetical protein
MLTRRAAVVFGVANVVSAGLVALGVFAGLPARWWPVDAGAGVVIALDAAAGAGLLARAVWAERVARAAAWIALASGLGLVTALAVAAAWLGAVYGPVGRGGAILFTLVGALALPYVVVLPVVELVFLGPAGRRG